MKILFYNHQGKVSGAEKVLLLILKRLDRTRFTPTLVCPETGTLATEAQALAIPFQPVDQLEARFTLRPDRLLVYLVSFVKILRQLRREISRDQPDLIHANTVRSGLVATLSTFNLKIPVIWHLHDELPRHPLSSLIRLFAISFKRIRLLSVSKATVQSFRGSIPARFGRHLAERVVHNGIDLTEFDINPEHRQQIRTELGLNDSEFVIGIVGQITPRKGQLELIETFFEVQKKIPNSTLLIVGSPIFNRDESYLEQLKQTAAALGIEKQIKFTGSRNDVAAVMQSLDLLVVNSKSEALVLVAIEAMACGTPVIATDVGGTKEIIRHQANGWIVPSGDKLALTEAILTLGENDEMCSRFAEESRKIVISGLNAERFISQIEGFYQECGTQKDEPAENRLALQG